MTPVIFFELYIPGSMVPCQDPGFIAVKLTLELVKRLRAVDALIKRHKLSQVTIEPRGLPVEVFVVGVAEPRVEIDLIADMVVLRVLGRRFDENEQPGRVEPLAESWVIGLDQLEHIRQQALPVTLYQWEESTELEESWTLKPFGDRVFDWLNRQGAYKRYLRLEWFDQEHVELPEEFDKPLAGRAARRRRRAETTSTS